MLPYTQTLKALGQYAGHHIFTAHTGGSQMSMLSLGSNKTVKLVVAARR